VRPGEAEGTVGGHDDGVTVARDGLQEATLEHVIHAIAIHIGQPWAA
jgi:hypothetical protein